MKRRRERVMGILILLGAVVLVGSAVFVVLLKNSVMINPSLEGLFSQWLGCLVGTAVVLYLGAELLGGDKMADDLIKSMNSAASQAAPKTADIFMDAISKMSLTDAQKILNSGENGATDYFKKNTTDSLKKMIKPIIQSSMKDNNVAQYYDMANNFYQSSAKPLLNNSAISGLAKNLGVNTDNSSDSLDDFVTQKAIDGLFL
jgi:hypothetical protein